MPVQGLPITLDAALGLGLKQFLIQLDTDGCEETVASALEVLTAQLVRTTRRLANTQASFRVWVTLCVCLCPVGG